jgi:hypothetical protein
LNPQSLEFWLGPIFSKVSGFFGWTNIKHNRKIKKLTYMLDSGGRRAQRPGVFSTLLSPNFISDPFIRLLRFFQEFIFQEMENNSQNFY